MLSDQVIVSLFRCSRSLSACAGASTWQRDTWPGDTSTAGGSTCAQISCASGQRVRKRQPDGSCGGETDLAAQRRRAACGAASATGSPRAGRSCTGAAARRRPLDAARSRRSRPRYITATRSAMWATTDSWCEMNTIASPSSLAQLAQQLEDLRLDRDVERADGLVGDQHARARRQRARDRDALALPAGQLRAGRASAPTAAARRARAARSTTCRAAPPLRPARARAPAPRSPRRPSCAG